MALAKLTKNCLLPWNFMQIHAGGLMHPCAVGPDADLGDFIIDYCKARENGQKVDILNNDGLKNLRKGLLTGNLRPMCRNCFFCDDELIPTSELERRVASYLQAELGDANVDVANLDKVYAFRDMAISFTNRCNLRCIYCVQSMQAGKNPYFSMDFPEKYIPYALDFFVENGIKRLRTCVEGEATVHKNWRKIFSEFHQKNPAIRLYMTTNLCRRFTDEDFELLARYSYIDVSCDTLDAELYKKIRSNGNLNLVLYNLDRLQKTADSMKIKRPNISLHMVVTNLTWPGLRDFANFCFDKGYEINLGNYEERFNTVAFHGNLLKPLSAISIKEQEKARDIILAVKEEAREKNIKCTVQGGLLYTLERNVCRNLNRFSPYDENPVFKAFHAKYPQGAEAMHLDIVYDYDNIAHTGILVTQPGARVQLEGLDVSAIELREVALYKNGHHSSKYNQTILPRYRKIVDITEGVFDYCPDFDAGGIHHVLVEILNFWPKSGTSEER